LSVVDERRAGILLGVLAYTIWGFLTIYWKALHDLGPFQLIGARIISSLVLLSVILAVTHRWRHLAPLARDRAPSPRGAPAARAGALRPPGHLARNPAHRAAAA